MIKEIFQRIGHSLQDTGHFPIETKAVEKSIHYVFQNKNLLLHAFKHRSYLSLTNEEDSESNERLEFLGDAVLDLIVTEHLYRNFKIESEGNLSKKKSVLVSRQVLAKLTDQLGLGQFLLINKGEEKTGGRSRQSNLANLFEAILGAIYLDGGYEAANKFVQQFVLTRMDEFLATNTYFNYKSSLLEYAQARGWGIPVYDISDESGPDHEKRFDVQVKINNKISAKGSGRSKKKAEQKAARNALRKIEQDKEKIKS